MLFRSARRGLRPKKLGNPFAHWHRYLNYGLLGLATRLSRSGHRPRVFHGHFDEPHGFVKRLARAGWLDTPAPVFLSIPSSYALPWAKTASHEIKRLAPGVRIVVGGRWVVANDGAWIRQQIPDADLVVYDPNATHVISAKTHRHRCDRNIFEGFAAKGKATHVVVGGRIALDNGDLDVRRGAGR